MNELASLGLILLFALMIGHLVRFVRIPEVTGYLLAGVLVGPSVLGWVTIRNLEALRVFSEVGIGLILFSIGGVFDIEKIGHIGRRLLKLALVESALAGGLVFLGMLVVGQPWQVSVLLGAIAMSTGAASTLMVIRENDSVGPLTDAITGVIGLNNVIALVAFSLVAAILDVSGLIAQSEFTAVGLVRAIFPLVWQLVGSAALGFLAGLLLSAWASKVVESGETLVLLVGCVLLTVGAATMLDLSPLVASLTVGATMANLSSKSRPLFDALSQTDPPLYVIFFVLAGAELNIGLLPSLGALGIIYVLCRAGGKLGGAWYAARRVGMPEAVQPLLGLALLAQAGLAVGLVLVTRQRFPQFSPIVSTVALGAVVVFEIAGPLTVRFALTRSGETRAPSAVRPLV